MTEITEIYPVIFYATIEVRYISKYDRKTWRAYVNNRSAICRVYRKITSRIS